MKNYKIVLASKSPRRKEILSMVASDFEIRVSDADETIDKDTDPFDVPRQLAVKKAEAVTYNDGELIIGCDTVVISPDNEIMGKPKDDNDAIRMLKKLSGTAHYVVSGIAIRNGECVVSDSVTTKVIMRNLTENEIKSYVSRYHPTDKAGAYGIQEMAGAFVSGIEGDFYNVVGLPLCRLCELLRCEFNVDLLS